MSKTNPLVTTQVIQETNYQIIDQDGENVVRVGTDPSDIEDLYYKIWDESDDWIVWLNDQTVDALIWALQDAKARKMKC